VYFRYSISKSIMNFEEMLMYECDSISDMDKIKKMSLKEFIFLSKKNKQKRESKRPTPTNF